EARRVVPRPRIHAPPPQLAARRFEKWLERGLAQRCETPLREIPRDRVLERHEDLVRARAGLRERNGEQVHRIEVGAVGVERDATTLDDRCPVAARLGLARAAKRCLTAARAVRKTCE